MDTIPQQGQKIPLESLSKEEIIQKCRGLLSIAKKAKQAKDEIFEENRVLKGLLLQHEKQKENDEKALMTMKEMLEAYTDDKLKLTTQVAELQKIRKLDAENIGKLSIENESLQRQVLRVTEDNESLLRDIENMEGQLKHVSGLSRDHRQQMEVLKIEIAELKEKETKCCEIKLKNDELCRELDELKEKYKFIKDISSEQRHKFNSLKDKFIEIHKKLKKLKECKRILLETQHEYADAISLWQNEIVKASKVLCKELNDLKAEKVTLLQQLDKEQVYKTVENDSVYVDKLNKLLQLSKKAKHDYDTLQEENIKLKQNLGIKTFGFAALSSESSAQFEECSADQKENIILQEHAKFKENCYIKASKLRELQELAAKANEEYKNKLSEIEALKQNIDKLKYEKKCLTKNNENQNSDVLKEKILLLEQENIPKSFSLEHLEDSLKHAHSEHEEGSDRCTPLNPNHLNDHDCLESLSLELKKVTEKNCILKEKMQELEKNAEAVLNLKEELKQTQQLLNDYQEKYKLKEMEHCELLDEMRELNEALKARGDLISRQQEEHKILKSELQENSYKLSKMQEESSKKDAELGEKQNELQTVITELIMMKKKLETLENVNALHEERIRVLSNELDNIKSSPSGSADDDNKSDILSTSTISKSDEIQIFKDIEDSFEDKYNKLRSLATKLKKRLQEEVAVKQNLEKALQELKNQENTLNAQIFEYKQKMSDIDLLNKQLNDKQKLIDSLKMENLKLKSSRKQANVLNLEIEAAEKSLTEVSNKLANRSLELEAAQESIKSKDSTITQLRTEIDLLLSSKSSEIKHSQELKQQIDHLHKTLKDEMHHKQQAYEKSKVLEQDVENLKLELENVKVELAQTISNQESALKSLNNEREQLSMQLSTTQAALYDCELNLKQAEKTTEDFRLEYLEYKVKAQAVLRQNQNRDSVKERELEEELLTMRATETQLKTTVQSLTSKIESLEKQEHLLNDDNKNLQKRIKELMILIEDVRTQNEALNQDIQQHIQQHHETLKQHRKQIESIDNCHKEQLQSLNTSHQKQLEHLRKEISQNVRLPTTIGATKSNNLLHHTHIDHSIDQGKLDILLMEREDAEGSEEAAETLANLAASRKISNDSSSVKRSMHDFMPLDELLNTPLNDINCETLITNSQGHQYMTDAALNELNSIEYLQLELNSTKERLQKQESRVRHLTALLAENELDLAKLTQLNDMLKEELRRQERSVEREQHLHNSEYVKNVIMKFITLNNADEKIRLVPVLNTILKLNRSEAEMLNCVAKGQKVSETSQRTGGWSNFLPWGSNNNN